MVFKGFLSSFFQFFLVFYILSLDYDTFSFFYNFLDFCEKLVFAHLSTTNLFSDFFVKKINFYIKAAKKMTKISQFVTKYSGILENWAFFNGFLRWNWNFYKISIFVSKFFNKFLKVCYFWIFLFLSLI